MLGYFTKIALRKTVTVLRPQDKMDNSAQKSMNRFTKITNFMQEEN